MIIWVFRRWCVVWNGCRLFAIKRQMLITVNGCLGSSPVNEKIRHQISRTDRQRSVFDSDSSSPDFKPTVWKNGREKRRRHFPDPAPKKMVKLVKAVFRPEKTRRQPHRLRHLHRLFPGHFEKLSAFSRPALSRRREKCHPPHHGPVHTPSTNDTAEYRCRWIDSPDQSSNDYRHRDRLWCQARKCSIYTIISPYSNNVLAHKHQRLSGELHHKGLQVKSEYLLLY